MNKTLSNQKPIAQAPLPQRVTLPLHMHIGAPAVPLVSVGERVLRGQMIAKPEGFVSAPVHASISGHVVAIGPRPVPHPSGLQGDCIVIESDGLDEPAPASEHSADYQSFDPSHLRNLVRQAGIVGLGGAAFPSAIKLNPGPAKNSGKAVDTLIINGAECEPYISCDDRLMRERAEQVVAGIRVIMHALGTPRCLIGIEDNKPEAQAAIDSILSEQKAGHIRVVSTPTIYPEGGEKQLVKVLTGKEIPAGGLPSAVGVVCQNVGTAVAIYQAVCQGKPLTSRVVTITGRGVKQPRNIEVRIGTPIEDLIEFCGGYTAHVERLIMGGPMMGFALPSDEIPVVKSTNCVLVATAAEVNTQVGDAMPCIRCGECADVCPVKLLPQQLYWHSKSQAFDKIQDYNLFDCIECGCCAQVCPSHIPLVQYYRFAKSEIWQLEKDRRKSDNARQRFESREARLAQAEAEKAQKAAAKKKQLEAIKVGADNNKPISAAAAAIAKAKAKAAQQDSPEPAISEAKAAAMAAIEKARAKQPTAEADSKVSNTQSAAQAAIAKAKAAAAKKVQTTTATTTEEAPSAAAAAIAKAKAKAAQQKASQTADNSLSPAEAKKAAALAAIAKAKQKAQQSETSSPADVKPEPAKAAALAAIAKAKAAAKKQPTPADDSSEEPS